MAKNKYSFTSKFSNIWGYPSLLRHPVMLYDAYKGYNQIQSPNGELEQQYRLLPYKMNNDQKSDVRHTLTNSLFVRKYPSDFVRDLGKYKEDVDLENNRTQEDTLRDLENNEYGIDIGQRYLLAPKTFLFDYALQNAGLPVPARDNTLQGYVDNFPSSIEEMRKWYNEPKIELYHRIMRSTDEPKGLFWHLYNKD